MEDTLDKALDKVGLSQKERKVYKTILEHGKIAPALVARKTGINRTTIYSVASELKARGLVVEDLGGKTLYYMPASEGEIDRVLGKDKKALMEKEKGLAELKEALKLIPQSKTFSIPKIRFVAEEDLEKYLYDATPRWTENQLVNDTTWWGFQDHTFVEHYRNWIVWFWKQAPEVIDLKLFSNESQIESDMRTEQITRRQIRFWKGENKISGTQWIVGSYIISIITNERPFYLVEINDAVLANNMREVFKRLWINEEKN
jgi:sugar-specific transcriptional regulator TrmB